MSLDPAQQSGSKCIQLICWLDDKHLPCVPPVLVIVPTEYPAVPPRCVLSSHEYATVYLSAVQRGLDARLAKLPKRYSVSQLLDTWEMSVRQASAPKTVNQQDDSQEQEQQQQKQQKQSKQPQQQVQQQSNSVGSSALTTTATITNGTTTVPTTAIAAVSSGVPAPVPIAPVSNVTLIGNGLPSAANMITMAGT